MLKVETVGMILAGGQGSRLGVLTKRSAKPAVQFGGKYKIIDFTISNCVNSGIETIGVLTQYKPQELNSHIGVGQPWDLDRNEGGISILPPYMSEHSGRWYIGTADAITQNIDYIDTFSPQYVLILSGDHIYKMNYAKMINYHKKLNAHATISVYKVPIEQASSFGVMNTREDYSIYEFEEKPKQPKSDLVSMGIYVFNWKTLKKYLLAEASNETSSHDFGKDIIPSMLKDGLSMYAYPFEGYWKDVGTIESFWESNMDLLDPDNQLKMEDPSFKIYSRMTPEHGTYLGPHSNVQNCIICDGSFIYGSVKNSIISTGVIIEEGAHVEDSIVMANCHIQKNAVVRKTIMDTRVKIGTNAKIGMGENIVNSLMPQIYNAGITVIGKKAFIPDDMIIGKNVFIDSYVNYRDFGSIKKIDSGKSMISEVKL